MAGCRGWGRGRSRRGSNTMPLMTDPQSAVVLSLRDLLAFQIPSWEREMKTAFMKATAGSSSKELPWSSAETSPPAALSMSLGAPLLPPLLKLRPVCPQLLFSPYATLFLGSGLSIYGQQQPPAQFRAAQAKQPGLVEHPQAVLLLPRSPEAPRDPALTGPAAWGPSAEWLHPEWNQATSSVN